MQKVINIDGGLGRAIALSGIINDIALKEKVCVMSPYDFLFDTNPNIEVLDLSNKNIFEEKIKDSEYVNVEPYNDFDFYSKKTHVARVYNKLVTGRDVFIKPKVFENPAYLKKAVDWIAIEKANGKKIMFIQPFATTGGNKNNDKEVEDLSYRSLKEEFVKKIVITFKDQYNIFVIKDNSQFGFNDTKNFTMKCKEDYFLLFSILKLIDVAICCDSFLSHLLEAVDSKARTIVLWGASSEKNFGYEDHYNLRITPLEFVKPLRLPHNDVFYQIKNFGLNDFGDIELEKIKKIIG